MPFWDSSSTVFNPVLLAIVVSEFKIGVFDEKGWYLFKQRVGRGIRGRDSLLDEVQAIACGLNSLLMNCLDGIMMRVFSC